jgi:dTDP-glucose 4,6-dehydratase
VTIHANPERTQAGSRHYIHAADVAEGLLFVVGLDTAKLARDYGGAKCAKFNLVGPEETDNLALAQMIAQAQGQELKYDLVDFHSQRPGHDLRYAMSGDYLRGLGWSPRVRLSERIAQVVQWSLANPHWLKN